MGLILLLPMSGCLESGKTNISLLHTHVFITSNQKGAERLLSTFCRIGVFLWPPHQSALRLTASPQGEANEPSP